MKNLRFFFLLSFTALFMQSCYINFDNSINANCVQGTGNITNVVRHPSSFHSIINHTDANIYILQGWDSQVSIVAQSNIISEINTTVSNGQLSITTRNCVQNSSPIDIYITMSDIRSIGIYGSGNLTGDNRWFTDNLELNLAGSGVMDVEVDAITVNSQLSGSGIIKLYGFTQSNYASISGSGIIKAFNLQTRNTEASINGTGDIQIYVSDYLKVRISGDGDVYYKGFPSFIDSHIYGSGHLYNDN